jgi:hypothetical protein
MALQAAVLGAQGKSNEIEADANVKKVEADAKYEDAHEAAMDIQTKATEAARRIRDIAKGKQDKRIADARASVSDARAVLVAHGVKAKSDSGIEIPNYLLPSSSVRL